VCFYGITTGNIRFLYYRSCAYWYVSCKRSLYGRGTKLKGGGRSFWPSFLDGLRAVWRHVTKGKEGVNFSLKMCDVIYGRPLRDTSKSYPGYWYGQRVRRGRGLAEALPLSVAWPLPSALLAVITNTSVRGQLSASTVPRPARFLRILRGPLQVSSSGGANWPPEPSVPRSAIRPQDNQGRGWAGGGSFLTHTGHRGTCRHVLVPGPPPKLPSVCVHVIDRLCVGKGNGLVPAAGQGSRRPSLLPSLSPTAWHPATDSRHKTMSTAGISNRSRSSSSSDKRWSPHVRVHPVIHNDIHLSPTFTSDKCEARTIDTITTKQRNQRCDWLGGRREWASGP